MNEIYKHYYTSQNTYRVYEYNGLGIFARFIDDPQNYKPYQDWIRNNTPEKISGSRFVVILDDKITEDANKDQILAAEKAEEETKIKDEQLRQEIASLDYKTLRYFEQLEMDKEGAIPKDKIKMDRAKFIEHLVYKQSLRDQVSDPKIDVSVGG